MERIDRAKCSSEEYGLCKRCEHYEEYSEGCIHCTMVVDIGYSFTICGIPVGSGLAYYHRNFEERRENDGQHS